MPPLGHLIQERRRFRKQGRQGRLGRAKADHAGAYRQLPLKAGEEHAAAVALRNPLGSGFFWLHSKGPDV